MKNCNDFIQPSFLSGDDKKAVRAQISEYYTLFVPDKSEPGALSATNAASEAAALRLTHTAAYRAAKHLLVFYSKANEFSTLPIIRRAQVAGKRIALPRVNGETMDFYFPDSSVPLENQLEQSSYGIFEPVLGLEKLRINHMPEKTLVIVPGLAFTLKGVRIGHGKGYYDRFFAAIEEENPLSRLPLASIGLCYEYQIFEELPHNVRDIPVTHLLTEKRFINCGQTRAHC